MSIAIPQHDTITTLTKTLNMPHLRREFEHLITTATTQRWAPADVLAACLSCEADRRHALGLKRRLHALGADPTKTFDTYNEDLTTVEPATLHYLKTLAWIDNKENLVIAGPSGTGKTHLSQALAQTVIHHGGKATWLTIQRIEELIGSHRIDFTISKQVKKLISTSLIVIDDIGLLPISEHAAEGLYRIIDACYEKTSLALSTNLHPAQFDTIMPTTLATASVDRLMHHAHTIITKGESIRKLQAQQHPKPKPHPRPSTNR